MVANTPGLAVGLVEAKVVRIWLTGRSAQGIKIADYEKPILTMLMQPDANMDSLVAADTLLKELVPVRMTLVPWLKVSPPEDGVEIFLKP